MNITVVRSHLFTDNKSFQWVVPLVLVAAVYLSVGAFFGFPYTLLVGGGWVTFTIFTIIAPALAIIVAIPIVEPGEERPVMSPRVMQYLSITISSLAVLPVLLNITAKLLLWFGFVGVGEFVFSVRMVPGIVLLASLPCSCLCFWVLNRKSRPT